MCRLLHFWLTVVNPLQLGYGRACRNNVPSSSGGRDASRTSEVVVDQYALPDPNSQVGLQSRRQSIDEELEESNGDSLPSTLTPCSSADVERLQSFVDVVSVSESELATLHPDWTKEDIDNLKREIRSFEDDMELLRTGEEEEEEKDAEEEEEVRLKDAARKDGLFKLDRRRQDSTLFHSCSSSLDSLRDDGHVVNNNNDDDDNDDDNDNDDDDEVFFSDQNSSTEDDQETLSSGSSWKLTNNNENSNKNDKKKKNNDDDVGTIEEVCRGRRRRSDRVSTNYWRLPSLHFSWRISAVTRHSKRRSTKRGLEENSNDNDNDNDNDNNNYIGNSDRRNFGKKDFDLAVSVKVGDSPVCSSENSNSNGYPEQTRHLKFDTEKRHQSSPSAKDDDKTSESKGKLPNDPRNCRIICIPKTKKKVRLSKVKKSTEKKRKGIREETTSQHLEDLPAELKDRLPLLQQPAFFGLQLVDWLTAALKLQQRRHHLRDDDEDSPEDDKFALHEPVNHKIYGGGAIIADEAPKTGCDEKPRSNRGENADATADGVDSKEGPARGEKLRHLVRQICTLLLAVGTLKSTEERRSTGNPVFKGEDLYSWNLPSPPILTQHPDGTFTHNGDSSGLCHDCAKSHHDLIDKIQTDHQSVLESIKENHLTSLAQIKDGHLEELSVMKQRIFTLKKDIVTFRSIAALESLLFMFMILLYAQRDKIPKEVADYFSANFSTTTTTSRSGETDDDDRRRCRTLISQSTQTESFQVEPSVISSTIPSQASTDVDHPSSSCLPIPPPPPLPPPLPTPPNAEENGGGGRESSRSVTSNVVFVPPPPILPPPPPPLPPPAPLPPQRSKVRKKALEKSRSRPMVFSATTLSNVKEGLGRVIDADNAPTLSSMQSPTNPAKTFEDGVEKGEEEKPEKSSLEKSKEKEKIGGGILTPPETPEEEDNKTGSMVPGPKSPPPPPPPPPPPAPFVAWDGVGGGPPLPPPLPPSSLRPGGGNGGGDKSLRKKPVIPKTQLKNLYWNRIQVYGPNLTVTEKGKGSIWVNLPEPEVDVNEIENLFEKVDLPKKDSKSTSGAASRAARLLDSKRSLSIGVLISSAHIRACDVYDAVIHWDTSIVEMDAIKNLYFSQLTPKELLMIKVHKESFQHIPLDKPEQFLWEMTKIHEFANRAFCMIFQQKFEDSIGAIEEKLDNIYQLSRSLLDSDDLRNIFGIILATGNYLNGGSRVRGQADGFGIDILPKLADLKTKDNQDNLLYFVVRQFKKIKIKETLKKKPKPETEDQAKDTVDKSDNPVNALLLHVKMGGNLASFRQLISDAEETESQASRPSPKIEFPLPPTSRFKVASGVNFDTVKTDLDKIFKDLEKCDLKAGKVLATADDTNREPFNEIMSNFIRNSYQKIASQKSLLNSSIEAYKDLCDYLCYKPLNNGGEDKDNSLTKSLPQPKDLFSNWIDFLEDFRIVWDDTDDDGVRKKSPKKLKKGNLQPNPKKGWQTPSKTASNSL